MVKLNEQKISVSRAHVHSFGLHVIYAIKKDGLFDHEGRRIAGDTEASIYEALGLAYKEPWERD